VHEFAEVFTMPEGRCMKCKKTVEIKDPKEIEMANKMRAVQGVCPVCGTKVFRILGKAKT
jgi:DNA-directed RNA polymerase subunit RPC12/RpoP